MDAAEVFWAVHADLPREGVGSDDTTRALFALAGRLPDGCRALDVGCGPGRSALVLAEAGAQVAAVDLHVPFLERLRATAAARGLAQRISVLRASMAQLPFADAAFDLVWSEGAAYLLSVDAALRNWRRLLRPGGVLVFTDAAWTTDRPSAEARTFWEEGYPGMRDAPATSAAAEAAGYDVLATRVLPDEDWEAEYYAPMEARIDALAASPGATDPAVAAGLAEQRREIELRRNHPEDYGYVGYVLRVR